jgi:hypothetical protein
MHILEFSRADGKRIFLPVSRLLRLDFFEDKLAFHFQDPSRDKEQLSVVVHIASGHEEAVATAIRGDLLGSEGAITFKAHEDNIGEIQFVL